MRPIPPISHDAIDNKHYVGYVRPCNNKELIALFIFNKHSDMEKVIGEPCRACFIPFFKPKLDIIGGICFSKKEFKVELLIHECSHAAFHYMRTVKPKFSLGKHYRHLDKEGKEEERFCIINGNIGMGLFKILQKLK